MADNKLIVVTQEKPLTFIKKEHDLEDLLKSLDPASKKAVKLLKETLEDEKADLKTRLSCANKILEYKISISQEVSKDQMQRLIAEIRINPAGVTKTLTASEDDPSIPKLDFDNIQSIED